MPSSISHSSVPPKFPDKSRRPGIIHLPQPLSTAPMSKAIQNKHKSHLSSSSLSKSAQPMSIVHVKPRQLVTPPRSQLRTPSPSPDRLSSSREASPARQAGPKRQRRRPSPPVALPLSPALTDAESPVPAFQFPKRADRKTSAVEKQPPVVIALISPPLTPAPEVQQQKKRKQAAGLKLSQVPPINHLASPPPSPTIYKSVQSVNVAPPSLPVFAIDGLADSDSDSDGDEEVILVRSVPPTRGATPPSPTTIQKWEGIRRLPRFDPATVAYLKQAYNIQPSKPSQPVSAPSTPGPASTGASLPIPVVRRPNAHLRSPSLPLYSINQVREEVAELFNLDSSDIVALNKAADAMEAYSGSTFNESPEDDMIMRAPASRFLSRMFA